MTSRIPMFVVAASLFFATLAAHASPIPTSTDEARDLARNPPAVQATRPVTSAPVTSTDEARALAGRISRPPLTPAVERLACLATNTDEARSGGGGCQHG